MLPYYPALPTLIGSQYQVSAVLGKYFHWSSFSVMVPVGGCWRGWFLLTGSPWKPHCCASYFARGPPPSFLDTSSQAHLLAMSLIIFIYFLNFFIFKMKKKAKFLIFFGLNSLKYKGFLGGQPSKYLPYPTGLDCGIDPCNSDVKSWSFLRENNPFVVLPLLLLAKLTKLTWGFWEKSGFHETKSDFSGLTFRCFSAPSSPVLNF